MPDLSSTFLGVELQTWVTSGAIVLLVGIAHLALGWLTRRRVRTNREAIVPGISARARYWIARGLSDAASPIALLLWLQGLYFAVTTLLADLPETAGVSQGYVVLGELRGVGTLLGLAWLLARIARTVEALLHSVAARTEAAWDDVLLPFAGMALRFILPMLALILGTPVLAVSEG